MIFIIKQGLEVQEGTGKLEIPAGSSFSSIRFCYISKDSTVVDVRGNPVDESNEDSYLIIYIRGRMVAIPKDMCEIPVSIGWRLNV